MPLIAALLGFVYIVSTMSRGHVFWSLVVLGFMIWAGRKVQQLSDKTVALQAQIADLQVRYLGLEGRLKGTSPEVAPVAPTPAPAEVKVEMVERVERQVTQEPAPSPVEKPAEPQVAAPDYEPMARPAWLEWLIEYFTTGNTIAKIGVVLLFFGVAFLLKYVSDRGILPIEFRLFATACGAIGLLGLGWKLRERRDSYAMLLQGGGIGVFYLTVFAAFRLYGLLPAGIAFPLLLLTVGLSSFLAVVQDSRALAVLGVSGGFLAPVLASTGKGSHVALFSYYALLNIGILGMARFRSWRELNLVGFLFTFVIGSGWGLKFYRPEYFASTEPFLIFFFLLYVAVAYLFSGRGQGRDGLVLDGSVVFGVPVAGFAFQWGLVRNIPQGLAWSAVALGLFYLSLARWVFRREGERLRLLAEAFFGLGVGFLTLAIPLAVDGKWTAAVWALEGVAIFWSGVRQKRSLPRWAGMLLQISGGTAFLLAENRASGLFPIWNGYFLGTTILCFSHLAISHFLNKAEREAVRSWEKELVPFFLVVGLCWWFGGSWAELRHAVPVWSNFLAERSEWGREIRSLSFLNHASIAWLALSIGGFHWLGRKIQFHGLLFLRLGLIPVLALFTFVLMLGSRHPLADFGFLAWVSAFGIHYRILRAEEARGDRFRWLQHFGAFWLLCFLCSWEGAWGFERFIGGASIWSTIVWAWIPLGMVMAVIQGSFRWREKYLGWGVVPILAGVSLLMLGLNFTHSGNPVGLPYLPLLNPIDLAQIFLLLAVGAWYLKAGKAGVSLVPDPRAFGVAVGLSVFVWLTAEVTRGFHHWMGLAWNFGVLFSSRWVQAALSLFWSLVALGLMIFATRRHWRGLWIAGGCLLSIVVGKLFLVDLSGRGTLERVVSFIGTGVLLLVIGYLAPMPPEENSEKLLEVKNT